MNESLHIKTLVGHPEVNAGSSRRHQRTQPVDGRRPAGCCPRRQADPAVRTMAARAPRPGSPTRTTRRSCAASRPGTSYPDSGARAETRPITPAGRRYAGEQIIQATVLLGWLADRGRQARRLHPGRHRRLVRRARQREPRQRPAFPASGRPRPGSPDASSCPPRRAPAPRRCPNATALRCSAGVLTDAPCPLRSRAAAAILLLYAQPRQPDHPAHHRRRRPRR